MKSSAELKREAEIALAAALMKLEGLEKYRDLVYPTEEFNKKLAEYYSYMDVASLKITELNMARESEGLAPS